MTKRNSRVELIIWLLVTAGFILVIERVVKGIEVNGCGAALFAAIVIGLVNTLLRPLLVILTIPLTILTLGLFLLVVNALMFKLAAALVPGFRIVGFMPAVWGSLLLTVMNMLLELVL